jgi:PIN domain nuclease of toxin-antitoxin system
LEGEVVAGSPCLLDTSTIIWAVAGSNHLSQAARRSIAAAPPVLSVVSYWEVVLKVRKGLLTIADPVNWWARAVAALQGNTLSVRTDHITALAGLPDIHKDPFDRLLIAQAVAEGLAVVTNDVEIRRYPVKTIWHGKAE